MPYRTTPGPWTSEKPSWTDPRVVRHIVDLDGKLIARVNFANPVQSENEALANASLLADAPAFLGALQELTQAVERDPLGAPTLAALAHAKGVTAPYLASYASSRVQRRPEAGPALSADNRYVVADLAHIQTLRAAVVEMRHMRAAKARGDTPSESTWIDAVMHAINELQTKPVMQALRMVRCEEEQGGDPAMMIVPPGVSDERAAHVLETAIAFAGASTADGETGDYFQTLQYQLDQEMGAHFTQHIHQLDSVAWDQCMFPEEPYRLPVNGDDEWARVRFTNPDDMSALEGEISDGEMVDGSGGVRLVCPVSGGPAFIGFATALKYRFPRSDRYGVPDAATEDGARKFIVNDLGFACSRDLEINSEDTGDDSAESFEIECLVPRVLLEPIVPAQEARDRSASQGAA